jgi:hypothetical protein
MINIFKFKIAMDFIKLLTATKIQISLWETKNTKSREINRLETHPHLYLEKARIELMDLRGNQFIRSRTIFIKLQTLLLLKISH